MVIHNATLTGSISMQAPPVISGSLTLTGSINATGDITASSARFSNIITAQTLVVQTVSSSITYSSGSNVFGNLQSNNQVFTGSLFVTGSIGIGTSSPTIKLFISDAQTNPAIAGGGPSGSFGFTEGNVTLSMGISGSNYPGWIQVYNKAFTSNYYPLSLNPNGGNVGIGTTNPTSLLEVQKDQNAQTGIRVKNTTSGTSAGVEFGAYTNSGNGGFGKYSTGNTPYKNIVAGSTYIYNGSSGDITLLNDAASGNISFAAGGVSTAQMFISASGNVGINKSSPDHKLSIVDSNYNQYSLRLESQSGNTSGRWGGIGFAGESVNTKAGIFFVSEGGSYSRGNLVFCNNSDFSQASVTTADTRMTITKEGNIGAPSGTNIYNASDVRLKQNITTITNGLNKIIGLNPVMFNWINGYVESEEGKNMLGFIAQEVQNIVPEAVESFSDGSNITVGETVIENPLRVNEKFIIPVLVKAIQELNQKFEDYKSTHP
jgi:hypothetical protein